VSVSEATVQRKSEQALYQQTLSELNIASSLLRKAGDRLAEQYGPKEEALVQGGSGAGSVSASRADSETADMLGFSFVQTGMQEDQPRTSAGGGILAMITKLRNDISASQAEKERDNQEQVKDYKEFLKNSADARECKKEAVTNKSAAKGRAEEVLNAVKKKKGEALTEQGVILSKAEAINANCNFIMENHEARAEARTNEIDGLKKSLAVLAGAGGQGFGAPAPKPVDPNSTLMADGTASFLQVSSKKLLRAR